MFYELSKSQKKIARKVMDKGLDNHYRKALSDVKTIINEWESGKFETSKDAYMKLFRTVDRNDNNLARTYDNKGGSRWVEIMSIQFNQGVITVEDLGEFDDDVRSTIMTWGGMK
jgi:ribosomal protein S20